MKWTRPIDLRGQVQKMWERGDIPASLVTGYSLFPKRLLLKTPTSTHMTERFDEVRAWISELRGMPHCRIEMREFKHRLLGINSVPQEVWIDSLDDALALISRQKAALRFTEILELTRLHQPQLTDWLAKRPLRALELHKEWGRILAIVDWLVDHPRPGIYLRQVDIPGISSKFIEAHRGVLSELLDMALPREAIDSSSSGVTRFATRYGFCDKPHRIRFRMLDPDNQLLSSHVLQDITLDAETFSRLQPAVSTVFITENEINFLAFPPVKESMVIFGSGYGFDMLSRARWLENCLIYYWGDIDTHGFAILDQLRKQFNHVRSFLMDHDTLLAFESQWGEEEKPALHDLHRLTGNELALYNDLRDNRLKKNLRLEQEKVGFKWVVTALAALKDKKSDSSTSAESG